MKVEVRIRRAAEEHSLVVLLDEGAALAPVLRERGMLPLPCGIGKCGKCVIHVEGLAGPAAPPALDEEREILGDEAILAGLRLACHMRAAEGLCITVPEPGRLRVLTAFTHAGYDFAPLVRAVPVGATEASLEDQRTDLARLMDACGAHAHTLSLGQLAQLPDMMRSERPFHALLQDAELVGLSSSEGRFALIVDIGTTTVAAFLADLVTGSVIAARGEQNAQASFGADVVSRIEKSMEAGVTPLRSAIIRQINAMLHSLLDEAGQPDADLLCLTGNTTMLHFLCGLPALHISRAPFIPVSLDAMRLNARELGLHSRAKVYLPPGISAYIGPDIASALLATGAGEENFLLIDFGTNAETVLQADGVLYACSAAAGPCFEGASLSCGMAGRHGAIDAVYDSDGDIAFTTLGGAPAAGLCGSGCMDALALLLEAGLVDETGRMAEADAPLPPGAPAFAAQAAKRIRDGRFYITPDVYVSQKDIREVQLAKAAVRAGVEVLLETAGIRASDVKTLYMAGGFGSAMRPQSAARTGLIPAELASRVNVLGNAAAFGALRYVTEEGALARLKEIADKVRYTELSAHGGFSTHYVAQMTFPVS